MGHHCRIGNANITPTGPATPPPACDIHHQHHTLRAEGRNDRLFLYYCRSRRGIHHQRTDDGLPFLAAKTYHPPTSTHYCGRTWPSRFLPTCWFCGRFVKGITDLATRLFPAHPGLLLCLLASACLLVDLLRQVGKVPRITVTITAFPAFCLVAGSCSHAHSHQPARPWSVSQRIHPACPHTCLRLSLDSLSGCSVIPAGGTGPSWCRHCTCACLAPPPSAL